MTPDTRMETRVTDTPDQIPHLGDTMSLALALPWCMQRQPSEVRMTYADRMRAILLADLARHQAREIQPEVYGSPITDLRAHLRGIGIVQPPLRYPHAAPRTRYSNPAREEGTSPNMRVYHADGTESVVPADTRNPRVRRNTRTASVDMQNAIDSRTRRTADKLGGSQSDYD